MAVNTDRAKVNKGNLRPNEDLFYQQEGKIYKHVLSPRRAFHRSILSAGRPNLPICFINKEGKGQVCPEKDICKLSCDFSVSFL